MVFCCRELLFSKLDRHPQQQPPPPVLRAAAGDRISRQSLSRQSFSTIDKCFFSRISDDTLGSFFAWLWTFLVLQSHDVLLPGAAFSEAVLPASAAAAAATSSDVKVAKIHGSSKRKKGAKSIIFYGFQKSR